MVKEKKERTQYNWKFKEKETEEFYQWFDNQENISSSLRSIVYHIIDLYGIENILDLNVQKQLVKDTLILESLRDKNALSVNHDLIFGNPVSADPPQVKNDFKSVSSKEIHEQINQEKDVVENNNQLKNPTEKNAKLQSSKKDIFADIDENLL